LPAGRVEGVWPASDDWPEYVARRRTLFDLLAAHDGAALAAESRAACEAQPDHPLVPHIARLHEAEVRIMQAIVDVDTRMRAAGEARLRAIERELRNGRLGGGVARAYAMVSGKTGSG